MRLNDDSISNQTGEADSWK